MCVRYLQVTLQPRNAADVCSQGGNKCCQSKGKLPGYRCSSAAQEERTCAVELHSNVLQHTHIVKEKIHKCVSWQRSGETEKYFAVESVKEELNV